MLALLPPPMQIKMRILKKVKNDTVAHKTPVKPFYSNSKEPLSKNVSVGTPETPMTTDTKLSANSGKSQKPKRHPPLLKAAIQAAIASHLRSYSASQTNMMAFAESMAELVIKIKRLGKPADIRAVLEDIEREHPEPRLVIALLSKYFKM